jgi:hypothetical protein
VLQKTTINWSAGRVDLITNKEAVQRPTARPRKLKVPTSEMTWPPAEEVTSMPDVAFDSGARKRPFNPNNKRVRELSKIARDQLPDDHGDYVLPETPIGQNLTIALLTHLNRAGQRRADWLFRFCAARAPWLDPDEIDLDSLRPLKAQDLGNQIGLTAERRERLHITGIQSCDETPTERAVRKKAEKRLLERQRRRHKREERDGKTRAEWLAANTASSDKPWEGLSMGRAKYYRLKAKGALPSPASASPSLRAKRREVGARHATAWGHDRSRSGETGTVPGRTVVARHATCLTPEDDGRSQLSLIGGWKEAA